jgi:outer membrane biosynthesis protein TonB
VSAELRAEWVCSRCSVRIYAPGKQIEAPTGWDREDDICLACAKQDETPEDRARRMLLDGTPIIKTARSCAGITQVAAKAIRAELVEEGELPPDDAPAEPKPKPKSKPKPKPKPKSKVKPQGTDKRTARAKERTEKIEA